MKAQMLFAGIAGALLLGATAGGAHAQARNYPDGADCAMLDGGALVQCQNQVYAHQLESGISQQAADPAQILSSHIEGNEESLPDFVPGAEGTAPPSAYAPAPVYSLEGPEGTRVTGPTE